MAMLARIARFEIRYIFRNPLLWVTCALTFGMFFMAMSVKGFELGSEGGLLANAAYAMLRNYVMISMIFMFVTTSFVANVVIRDDETGFGPIVRSTRITKLQYLAGRFLGAFIVAALCMLVVPLATILGSVMPWADASQLGPNRLLDHLYGYFLLALPNLFMHAAIFFALATITRSMMATYLGVVGLVSGFFFLQGSFTDRPLLQKAVPLLDAFGARALSAATRYWTIPERNTLLPDFAGVMLYNRLLWIGVALLCLGIAYSVFRFADQGMSRRDRKKQRLERDAPVAAFQTTAGIAALPKGRPSAWAVLRMRTKFEFKQVLMSPAFAILMAWGLYLTTFVLSTQRDPDGRPTFPTTLSLIPDLQDAFEVILLIIAIYYAGELVWRERDRRMHHLIDASPLPNWGYVVPKTLAMAFVLLAVLLSSVVASVLTQLSLGYTHLEPGKYLLWYVLPGTCDMLLLAALAIFVQALSPHKFVGWGIMVLFLAWKYLNEIVDHNLLNFGGAPGMPLSDLNGAGSFWIGAWAFRIYWGAFALLLLLMAHLLWRRGTDVRLKPRLAHALRRLAGGPGYVAAAVLLLFIGTGAYAYYNTNVLNDYQTSDEAEAWAAKLEKKYGQYDGLPQPVVTAVTLNVALEPKERRAVTNGHYTLRNVAAQPITDVHVRLMYRDVAFTKASLAGARVVTSDDEFGYRIFRLDAPMQPGEERVLSFETLRWHRGFPNKMPNTSMVENGTFLHSPELMPLVDVNVTGSVSDPETRRKYGLVPDELPQTVLEDVSATMKRAMPREWVHSDITVSTTADQTPIAPGKKISDVTRGGRRIARFVSEAPIRPHFSIQSARYAEKTRRHAGVDLVVYYHPAHAWNVDRMLDALAVSLDLYRTTFGPYQFSHVRIVEAPGYNNRAEAFAGTIPYSETYGFIANAAAEESMDHVTGTTAHELAHQYWGHQVTGAATEGQSVLSETLAQYSAMLVVLKVQGEDHLRRHLQYELNKYLNGRAIGSAGEPPLARVEWQSWVSYQKGSLAMRLLHKRLGEEAVNRALRNLLQRYKFKGPPYPRTLDLIALLRAEAKTPEEQNLITDLFERLTTYDLKVSEPTAVQRPDGKWNVTVPIEAKKRYADGKGAENETAFQERIEVGLFTAKPGYAAFDAKDVVLLERHPIRSGRQVLRFVTARKPEYAGVDPYRYYIDRAPSDNVAGVQ